MKLELRQCLLIAASLACATVVAAFAPPASAIVQRHSRTASDGSRNDAAAAALLMSSSSGDVIRYLGTGTHAIVRPGVVLVAPADEYHHYYRHAAIYVYAMGTDDEDVYVIRGLIIDHPTPFTVQEMMKEAPGSVADSPLGDNFLWRGGDKGGDTVVLVHNRPELSSLPQIGTSGLYQGGWEAALQACTDETVDDFKTFFNYCEFTEKELEDMLDSVDDDGDGWSSVEVDSSFVLDSDWDRGAAWARLRNGVAQIRSRQPSQNAADEYE